MSELLSACLDGEVEAPTAKRVQGHLERCPSCRAELARLERLDDVLKSALQARASEASWQTIWPKVATRIGERAWWPRRLRDYLGLDALRLRPAWLVSAAVALGVALLGVATYLTDFRTRNNFAFVESIDGHGANIALFREAETRTTVIWLFEDVENQDALSEESATASPGF
ncbi:MAG TPA: zf-HC2 domain-containing protein [Candidatus Acidoferrales bacterium]|nr:zf-HC2 domain-containing protein [Candidatus Acidoferrales bacterium]